jgi:hypothetical protein
LLKELGQRVADRLDRVGVFGVMWKTLLLEVGPLTHKASPFNVHIANKFFQKVFRVENALAVTGQNDERLVKVVEQELAPLNVTIQNDS